MSGNQNPSQFLASIWLADWDRPHRQALANCFQSSGIRVVESGDARPPSSMDVGQLGAALIDNQFPDEDLAETLKYLRHHAPHLRPLMMISRACQESNGLDSNFLESISKPIDPAMAVPLLRQTIRAARERRRVHQLEERVRNLETSSQAIVESSLDCILQTDGRGIITDINAATTQTLGYVRDELVGKDLISSIFPESLHERYREAVERFRDLGIEGSRMGRRLEVTALHSNGTEFPAEIALIPVTIAGRTVFTAYLRDITSRKQAEETLRRTHARMKRDLEAASRIQHSLLPDAIPDVREASIAWRFQPCDELAGDTLNVLRLDRDHLGVYVLDVSGHGVPAALHAVMLHRLLSVYPGQSILLQERRGRIGGYEIVPPSDVLDRLNRRFPIGESVDNRYFTIHYGIIDLRTGRYSYAHGGHPFAILSSPDRLPRMLEAAGLPIGFSADTKYEQFEAPLVEGDRLMLYSDGVVESSQRGGEQYGVERLMSAVHETRQMPVREALDAIYDKVTIWRGRTRPEDDISMLAVQWKARRAPSTPIPHDG